MKPMSLIHPAGAVSLALAVILLAGCASLMSSPDRYEYRYRVFEADEPLPAEMHGPFSIDVLAKIFLPVGALNRTMDLLGEQGFKLAKVERIAGTSYYTLTFERPLPMGYRPTRAPMEFTGVYRGTNGAESVYYALTPIFEGYQVSMFEGTGSPGIMAAEWDGKILHTQEHMKEHQFVLSGDGTTLVHIIETLEPETLGREVYRAVRTKP